ncbi:MAG: siderophore-interacting protein, partial [Microbacterium sp.]
GYTFVDIRPDEGTFALDFVLHEQPGPAGDWAKRLFTDEGVAVGGASLPG